MSRSGEKAATAELMVKGLLLKEGVKVSDKRFVEELLSRGYGVSREDELLLAFYEALYLLDRAMLEIEDENGGGVDFQRLLQFYEMADKNAWSSYLVFRDLRSRGYVVREGFGWGVDFRVYERGDYSKATAKFLIVSAQEGKPMAVESLRRLLKQSLSLKKELVLAVMNRRGEIVYYTVSELNL
jgi:tRNA-intron endonuclease